MGALTLVLKGGSATVIPPVMSNKMGGIFLVIGVLTVGPVGAFQSGRVQEHQKGERGKELEDLLGHDDEGRRRRSRDPYLILLIWLGIENKQTTTMKGVVGELKERICTVFIQCFERLDKAL